MGPWIDSLAYPVDQQLLSSIGEATENYIQIITNSTVLKFKFLLIPMGCLWGGYSSWRAALSYADSHTGS